MGSRLSRASRRESFPVRYMVRGRLAVSARMMVAAATSGGLPWPSRSFITASMLVNVAWYRARPGGLAAARSSAWRSWLISA